MNEQLSLLGPEPRAPYRRHSVSSREGAKRIEPTLDTMMGRALAAYRFAGDRGLTDEELADQLGVKLTTAIPRRHELIKKNYVALAPAGRRKASSGQKVGYWVAIEFQRRTAA